MNIVAHNLTAMNAGRQLNIVTNAKQKTTERLSSGYRINRAADDAAGLSISEKMRAQIRGLNQGRENVEDGISYVQVADGALDEVNSLLQRINELAVQAANGTNSESDREAINEEVNHLKSEMQRIFTTTSFNEIKIWPESSISQVPEWAGTVPIQAVKITTPNTQTIKINNNSYDKVASSGYKINADNSGVSVSWTDYDGISHATNKVDWNTLESNNYSFQVADYFNSADTELFDNGTPLFDFKISMNVAEEADVKDIIASIDGTTMYGNNYVYMNGRFEDVSGTDLTTNIRNNTGVSIYSVTLTYGAAYASREYANTSQGENGYDFEGASDSFAKATVMSSSDGNLDTVPANNTSDLDTARNSNDGWSFTFEMEGIGEVTATSYEIRYYAYDRADDDEKLWWKWNETATGKYVTSIGRVPSDKGNGTLGSLMSSLTGDANSTTPGILNKNNGGAADDGGYIYIYFDLNAKNSYSYGNGSSSKDVGSMRLTVEVTKDDDESTVLNKINTALNSATIIDLYTTQSNIDNIRQSVSSSSVKNSTVDHDVYKLVPSYNDVNVNIHAGPASSDKIYMNYKCLRIESLGLKSTNVLTEESATKAIDEVSKALEIVSNQRSKFGAYQNRLECAKAIDENTEENTTAAESRIRDADMAEEMVKYSKENILHQVGQNMLAQANQSNQGVLTLLG